MIFGIEISQIQLYLIAGGLLLSLLSMPLALPHILRIIRRRRLCEELPVEVSAPVGASIIVYSVDEADRLAELLPQLLTQQYAGPMEVIVVNEGDSRQVRDIVESLQTTHHNLYLTHTPDGARSLSRKKLAITLGIKAARYDVAVLTEAQAVINSTQWLARIMRHFSDDTQIVFGYAAANPDEDHTFGARARAFDVALGDIEWLSAAIGGHPRRGTSFNIAYRRELFFAAKGFSHSLNLRHGDDDIFINRIARGVTTAVELSDTSVVKVPGINSRGAVRQQRAVRRFTERFIHPRRRLMMRLSGILYTAGAILPVVALALPPFTTHLGIAVAVAILCWYPIGLIWLRPIRAIGARHMSLSLPWLAATRPIRLAIQYVYSRLNRGKQYTWE